MARVAALSLAVLLLAGCTDPEPEGKTLPKTVTRQPEAKEPRPPSTPGGFVVYPGSRVFDDGRVYAPRGPHITWEAYAAADRPETVAAFYEKELGSDNLERKDGEWTWRFPAKAPTRVLSVTSPDTQGPWDPDRLPEDATCVIELSERPR